MLTGAWCPPFIPSYSVPGVPRLPSRECRGGIASPLARLGGRLPGAVASGRRSERARARWPALHERASEP